MNFIPLLRHNDFYNFLENTNRVLNEIPIVEKNLIEKLTDSFVYKHAKAREDGRYEIVVHLPGVGKNNIKIEIDEVNRVINVVDRATFPIPEIYSMDVENLEKTYIDGVLCILLPKISRGEQSRRTVIGF